MAAETAKQGETQVENIELNGEETDILSEADMVAKLQELETQATGETVTTNGRRRANTDAKAKNKGILGILGHPRVLAGDGKQYPRTTGFRADRKPHPGGGTNETAAFFVWTLDTGVTLEGRMYCQKFTEDGKAIEEYAVSLPFLKAEPKNAAALKATDTVKVACEDLFFKWLETPEAKSIKSTAAITKRAGTRRIVK